MEWKGEGYNFIRGFVRILCMIGCGCEMKGYIKDILIF